MSRLRPQHPTTRWLLTALGIVGRQTVDPIALALVDVLAAAVVAIIATPAGPDRDLEVAAGARRIAAGPGYVAIVISEDLGAEELQIAVQLHRGVQLELESVS